GVPGHHHVVRPHDVVNPERLAADIGGIRQVTGAVAVTQQGTCSPPHIGGRPGPTFFVSIRVRAAVEAGKANVRAERSTSAKYDVRHKEDRWGSISPLSSIDRGVVFA
ncbi:hypothetical protein, partial [Streptomyces sp. NPDC056544]|uniref:hypothetical protein n=1 Tax=Streptomyces sp. NPDC056544 TaxID=3345863 RepID=UPI003689446E